MSEYYYLDTLQIQDKAEKEFIINTTKKNVEKKFDNEMRLKPKTPPHLDETNASDYKKKKKESL